MKSIEASTLVHQGQTESSGKLSPQQLKDMQRTGAVMVDGAVDFDNIQGESFVGKNILSLAIGQADGPFKVVRIEPTEFKKGKDIKTINVVICEKGTTEVRMPIAGSFMSKATEADLKVGDVIYVKRGENFVAKDFGTQDCKSYLIKRTFRAPSA